MPMFLEIFIACVATILISKFIYHLVVKKRIDRPRCPNKYNCADCIYSDIIWTDKFRGFSCSINAR